MTLADISILEEILLMNGHVDSVDEILHREMTILENEIIIKLDLSNLNIIEIPSEIEELDELQVLDLRNNDLRELPDEIIHMSKLEEVLIKGNNFPLGIDLDEYTSLTREKMKLQVTSKNCLWCNKNKGFIKRSVHFRGEPRIVVDESYMYEELVCKNCGYSYQFSYSSKL